jgi:hypothetical protein
MNIKGRSQASLDAAVEALRTQIPELQEEEPVA